MSNSISKSRTQRHSAQRWCQLMAWTAVLLFTLPLKAGFPDNEIMTYQGRLLDNGAPYTGAVDMNFSLWTQESGGSMVVSQSIPGVAVSGGLFQVELEFGSQAYDTSLWLEVEADGITLTSRQRVTAVPLALHTLNGGGGYWELSGGVLSYDGAVSIGTGVDTEALTVNGEIVGVMSTGGGNGVLGMSNDGIGVQGFVSGSDIVNYGVMGTTFSDDGYGVFASNLSDTGTALRAEGYNGMWIDAEGTGLFVDSGTFGITALGGVYGIYGLASEGAGVQGWTNDADGYGGYFQGVAGSSSYFGHPVGIGASDPAATLDINGPGVGGNNLALRISVSDDEKFVVGGLGTTIYQPVFIDGTVAISSFLTGASTDVCHTGSPGFTGVLAECSSSARYKSDIASLRSTMALVEQLRPVSYRWTESGEEDVGLVAEEVAEIEPRLVTYNRNGQVEGVKYRQLSALLIGALQEQHRDIERMQGEIQVLTQQLEQPADLMRHNRDLSDRVERLEAVLLEWQAVARQD
jgi:hypothetical protein